MPLYGQSEGANTLSIARPTVLGDHNSRIAAFDPINCDEQRRLPTGQSFVVEVGEPWQDVFIWNDVAYIGTPKELWDKLAPYYQDLATQAPLSLLDLTLHAGRDELSTIAGTAFGYLSERFGELRAQSWRKQFLRQRCEVELRRTLSNEDFDDALFRAICIHESTSNELTIEIPEELASLCKKDEVQTSVERVSPIAEFMGVFLILTPSENAVLNATASFQVKRDLLTESSLVSPDDAPVLILTYGKRAREVARHLNSSMGRDATESKMAVLSAETIEFPRFSVSQTKSVIAIIVAADEEEATLPLAEMARFLDQQVEDGALVFMVPA